MFAALDRHERIALLFLIGIGIPSLLIAFLAFRGIQDEVLLLDQRTWEAHRLVARRVTASVNIRIAAAERVVYSALEGRLASGGSSLDEVDLQGLHVPLVEAVFRVFPDSVHVLWPPLLYGNEGPIEADPSAPLGSQLRAAERLEFNEDRPERALALYRDALEGPVDPRGRASVLLSIARIQRRMGTYQDMEATYRSLLATSDSLPALGGIPFGAIAMLELGSLTVEDGNAAAGIAMWVGLQERLLAGRWRLGRDHFAFLVHRIHASFQDALPLVETSRQRDSLRAVIRRLERQEAARVAYTERLLLFLRAAPPRIGSHLENASAVGGRGGLRFPVEVGGISLSVVVSPLSLAGKPWGMLVNDAALVTDVIAPELARWTDSVSVGWVLRDRQGRSVAGTLPAPGRAGVTAAFAGGVPPWLLEVYRRPAGAAGGGLEPGRNPYVYLLIFLASLLAVGLAVTFRAVHREMELAQLKSRFVSTVSHEFKSPLTSIRHISEMLLDGRVGDEDRRQRYYRVLLDQGRRLSALVANILDAARVEEGKAGLRVQPVSATTTVHDAVATIQERFGKESPAIRVDIQEGLPRVRADPDALAVVLTNLLDNAVRYADGSGDIHVRAASAADSNGTVSLSVRDFGGGIPPEERSRVFERFVRGRDACARHPLGTGLGLALVKELVERHGGSVGLEEPLGGGSVFTVSLPIWEPGRRGA